MLTWLIILMIVLLFSWLLFSPMVFHADTLRDEYFFRYKGLILTRVLKADDEWWIRLYLFSVPVRKFPIKRMKMSAKRESEKRKKKGLAYRVSDLPDLYKIIKRFIRTFEVRNLHLDIDTGDVVLNAYLYPFPLLWRNERFYLNINFDDVNALVVTLRNRMVRIIPILFSIGVIYYRIKKRNN